MNHRLRRCLDLLLALPAEPTREQAPQVQAARLELDRLLAELWAACPRWPGAGYVTVHVRPDEEAPAHD